MKSKIVLVLIHSPLVGPFTWSLVAHELRARDIEVRVPTLADSESLHGPYWKQYADIVAHELASIPLDHSITLIGHSGAGPLLPAIRQAIDHPVASYVFVDAGIPRDGASYLDLLATELPEQVEQFRQLLSAGGNFPNWNDEMLRPLIPDSELRRRMLAELHPRPMAFFEEPLPVFPGWPDAPCYYLQLSSAYDLPATQAQQEGWTSSEIKAGHFHMLVEPAAVADAILQLLSPVTHL